MLNITKATPLASFLVISILLTGCEIEMNGGWGKKKKDTPPQPVPVQIETVKLETISSYFRFNAILVPEKEIQIFPKAIGIVLERFVEEGDYVDAGRILARLEDSEQKLTLDRAEANFRHQSDETSRAEDLFNRDMLSDDEIRRIRLAKNEADISLRQARLALEYTKITAPFAGVITKRLFNSGDRVDLSRPLFTLVDRSRMYADAWISEGELQHIKIGTPAKVLSFGDTPVVGRAKTLRISSVIDPTFGKIKVTFLLDSAQTEFRPGQFIELLLTLDSKTNVTVIPKRAVLFEAGDPVVFIVQDSLALRRQIKTGIGEAGRVEVVQGLSAGQSIVVDGHSTLRDSSKVRPLPMN